LYKGDQERANLANLVRYLVRDGLSHLFIAKPLITVTKTGAERHLRRDSVGCLLADCLVLSDDLLLAFHAAGVSRRLLAVSGVDDRRVERRPAFWRREAVPQPMGADPGAVVVLPQVDRVGEGP